MAATAAFPTLSVPAPEDTMEISSPARLPDDHDIDLDFGGEYDDGVPLEDDEQMAVDGEQAWLASANDASMDDDAQPEMQEAHMQDDQVPEDDELIDYDEDFFDQPLVEDTVVEDIGLQPPQDETVDNHNENITSQPDDLAALIEEPSTVTEAEQLSAGILDVPQTSADEQVLSQDTIAVNESILRSEATDDQSAEVAAKAAANVHEPSVDNNAVVPAPLAVDTTVEAATDAAATPTDTGLHPVTLYYDGFELPLFKSRHQQEGLLKDDNLASLSLAELLRASRARIASKLGRTVPEEQDLVLSFDHLGLILVENSRCTFQTSLHDVLEVYLLLHHNDRVQDVPPLSLTLTQQFKFSSNLAMLKQRAEHGDGVPQLEVQQATVDDDQEYNQEHCEHHEELDEPGIAAQDQAQASEENDGSHANAEGQAYDEDDDQEEVDYDDDEQNEQPDDATGHLQDQGAEPTEHDQTKDLPREYERLNKEVESAQEQAVDPETVLAGNDVGETPTAPTNEPAQELVDNDGFADADEDPNDGPNEESTRSSQTVQGDDKDDIASEYNEDLIDWDDNSDLTSKLSEPEVGDQDEFSTFLSEFDAEEVAVFPGEHEALAAATEDANGSVQYADDVIYHPDVEEGEGEEIIEASVRPDLHVSADDGQEDLYHEHEDYLGDGTTFVDDNGEQYNLQADDLTAHENEDANQYQADTSDGQQEHLQPAEQPDLAQGVHESLDEHDPNNGPEYDANDDSEITHNAIAAKEGTNPGQDEEQLDPEDDLIFDDETTEQHEAKRKASQPELVSVGSGSPLGKRSFDEHTDLYDEDDEPDLKKVRSQ